MEQTTFTYEAREQMLVIHLPGELDHHNCRNLKRDTDLLLAENYINRIVFDFTHTSVYGFIRHRGTFEPLQADGSQPGEPWPITGQDAQVRRILADGRDVSRLIRGYEDRESANERDEKDGG